MDDPVPAASTIDFSEVFESNRTMCPVTRYYIKTTNEDPETDTDPTSEEA
jgi:hypothetical protein